MFHKGRWQKTYDTIVRGQKVKTIRASGRKYGRKTIPNIPQ